MSHKQDEPHSTSAARRRYARFLTQGAVVAAAYVVLTWVSSFCGLAGGAIQFRLSEALCVLPAMLPAAIPGLFIGCLLSNLLTGAILLDVLCGAFATLLGAVGAYLLRRYPLFIPIPTVVANVLAVPPILKYAYGISYAFGSYSALPFFMLTVGIGEVACAYILGLMLYRALDPHRGAIGALPRPGAR